MSFREQLHVEINRQLDALAAAGELWIAPWIAHAIMQQHEAAFASSRLDDDRLIVEGAARAFVRNEVRLCVNRRAGDKRSPDADHHPTLFEGYRHLQRYYMVARSATLLGIDLPDDDDDDRATVDVGIPVEQMTDAELRGKAGLHRSFAAASNAHADELDRYRRGRRVAS